MNNNPEPTAEELLDFLLNAPADDDRWPRSAVSLGAYKAHIHNVTSHWWVNASKAQQDVAGFVLWLESVGSAHVSRPVGATVGFSKYVDLFLKMYPEIAHQLAEAYKYERQL